ncbi:MAG: sodium:solute symporter [Phaeodactylibacter sp.]|nr:sodium:solute symporter [Phaeodactylibacter sp.]MCB9052078.1 sodium:solute symporter [Lewinellaceae bacterium]
MNTLDYIIVVVYAVGFLGLGYIFKDQKDGKDYFLGGKSFGWLPLGLSVMATQLSAISFISAPAFVGIREGGGLEWLSYELAVPIAMIFLMAVLFPPLYNSGVVSIYEYLERRFSASSRLLLSFVFLMSRAFATGVMIYAVSIILESVLDISFFSTLAVIGVITLIYSLQGGMKAVVYGDMIQMIILFVGIIACMAFGLVEVGGWDNFLANLDRSRLEAVDFSSLGFSKGEEFGFWPMVIGGFFLYVSYYGTDQSQAQRMLSARDLATVRKTLLFNGMIRFPITFAYCFMGLIIGTMVLITPEFQAAVPADKPDMMIPVFIRDYLPHGMIGLLIVAILSAAMSSLSSAINSLSAVTMEDFISRGKELPAGRYMVYSRFTALFWGLVCIFLAVFAGNIADTVIEAINKVGSVFFGPILATFLLAIMTKKTHALGANIGLAVGVIINVFLWLAVEDVFWFWWNFIGAAVTLSLGYGLSLVLPGTPKEVKLDFKVDPKWLFTRESKLLMVFFVAIVLFSMFFKYMI